MTHTHTPMSQDQRDPDNYNEGEKTSRYLSQLKHAVSVHTLIVNIDIRFPYRYTCFFF